jgi:hypothetical protein
LTTPRTRSPGRARYEMCEHFAIGLTLRQVYKGHTRREYVPLDARGGDSLKKLDTYSSSFGSTPFNKRRGVSAPVF